MWAHNLSSFILNRYIAGIYIQYSTVNSYPHTHKISYYSSNSADFRAQLNQKREFIDNARSYIKSYQFLIDNIRTNNYSRYLEQRTILEIEIQIEKNRIYQKSSQGEERDRESLRKAFSLNE